MFQQHRDHSGGNFQIIENAIMTNTTIKSRDEPSTLIQDLKHTNIIFVCIHWINSLIHDWTFLIQEI